MGNKYDLIQENPELRQVSLDEIEQMKNEYNLKYIETSALANIRVNETFENLLEGKLISKIKMFIHLYLLINQHVHKQVLLI